MANKIDSNVTGLSYAEESSMKTLPGTPIWYPLEPNSYSDFGGQISTVARNPINPSRQRKKGVTVDLDASGGFQQDLTQTNLMRLMQGFAFASIREKATTTPMNANAVAITSATASTDTYAAASGLGSFKLNDLILASGFSMAANNGLKVGVSSTSSTVVVGDGLADEASPPAGAALKVVGTQFASATVNVDVSGTWPRLVRASGTVDWTTLGLIPGEWVFIGGDSATLRFTNAGNNGFARVRAVTAAYIEFDKTAGTMVTETGTGKTVQMFFGNLVKNEATSNLIVRRTYQLERQLGSDANGVMSEYLVGATPNEMTVNIAQADKITVDMSFVAVDVEQRTGLVGIKAGTRPALVESPAFNTSSDFSRIKMHLITSGQTNPTPLFAYLTDLTLTVNNNVTPNKAVATLGAFDVSAGQFQVSGDLTAYFSDVTAVQAVRNNSDVSLDFALVKNNAGYVFDIPLIALGDGRLNVEQDQPITLPLSMDAAAGSNNHTLLVNEFPYLPTLADS